MKQIIIIPLIILGLLVSCEVAESEMNTDIEDAIMKVIAEEDAQYGVEDWSNTESADFGLANIPEKNETGSELFERVVRDSNYVWKFARRNMDVEREVIIEVEDDTSAQSLITDHITGSFIVKQFERVWTTDGRWHRGDSVRFSEKPIDNNSQHRVMFKKRIDAAGAEHWIPVASTMKLEQAGANPGIEALQIVRDDTLITLTDFETEFYSRRHPLVLAGSRLNVLVSNDVAGEAEMVTSHLGFNPRIDRHGQRSRFHFRYVETLDNGNKLYEQDMASSNSPQRRHKGSVEVLDLRTLFDHDYAEYSTTRVGFVYDRGRRQPPSTRP